MANDVEQLTREQTLNGESPVWSSATGRLFWIDIRGPALHEFDPDTGTDRKWEMPSWMGACYLTNTGVALTLRGGLFAFDRATSALKFLAGPPYDARRLLFNDGRCDRQGRLFAGPFLMPLNPAPSEGDPAGGPLWRYDGGNTWTPVTHAVGLSNSLAWSPDGRIMYHTDTKKKIVWAYDYDPSTGENANRREFVTVDIPGAMGPDGASVDRDGFFWVAVFEGGCVLRFDPAGKLERRVDMPCTCPSMPAFGGVGLDAIYVTSAAHTLTEAQRKANPAEGCLFRFPAPVPGLAEAVFELPPGLT